MSDTKLNAYESLALLRYYGRKKFYQHMVSTCGDIEQLSDSQRSTHYTILLYKSIALMHQDSNSEALRVLQSVQNVKALTLAVVAAQLYAHKQMKQRDTEEIAVLKKALKNASKTNDSNSLLEAATFFWLTDKHKQARSCLERIVNDDSTNVCAQAMLGWVDLSCGDENLIQNSVHHFDNALKNQIDVKNSDIDALMGRAEWYIMQEKFDIALENLNMVIAQHPRFLPVLIEKAHMHIAKGVWEDARDCIQRAFSIHNNTVAVLFLRLVDTFTHTLPTNESIAQLQHFRDTLMRVEPRNAILFHYYSHALRTLAAKHKKYLKICSDLMDNATRLVPASSSYRSETAQQRLLSGDVETAIQIFSEASQLDESNFESLYGMILCKILRAKFDDAAHELEFMAQVHGADTQSVSSPKLLVLQAMLAFRTGNKKNCEPLLMIQNAIKIHLRAVKLKPAGLQRMIALDIDFVVDSIQELLDNVGGSPNKEGDPPRPRLSQTCELLRSTVAILPGSLSAMKLLCRALFLNAQFTEGLQCALKCLVIDPHNAAVCMLQAQMLVGSAQFNDADTMLEKAVSLDFEVRTTAMYHLLKGSVLEHHKQCEQALELVESGMNLPGVRRRASTRAIVPIAHRVSLTLLLTRLLSQLNKDPEAAKTLEEARIEFADTVEIHRIELADAELSLHCGDIDSALSKLKNIVPASPLYFQARMKMADIFLNHRHDRRAYAQCFEELAQINESAHMSEKLGDAYLSIQEPQKAIIEYEKALDINEKTNQPVDVGLMTKIGKALVATHEFAKAVEFYTQSIDKIESSESSSRSTILSHELAELYTNLHRFDDARRILQTTQLNGNGNGNGNSNGNANGNGNDDNDESNSQQLIMKCKSALLMAEVECREKSSCCEAAETLLGAYELQKRVLKALVSASSDTRFTQQKIAADISCQLAAIWIRQGNRKKGEFFYEEALRFYPQCQNALLALAKSKMDANKLEESQKVLASLLQAHPQHHKASEMLAELMLLDNKPDAAVLHYKTLLQHDPSSYVILVRLIKMLRRTGRLDEAEKLVNTAMKKGERENGLHYAQGLMHMYRNKPRDALVSFNHARCDSVWGIFALESMITLYLNPDNQALFKEASQTRDAKHLHAADVLLHEFEQRTHRDDAKLVVLGAFAAIASGSSSKIEAVIPQLLALVKSDREYVPAFLALATAFSMINQIPKARNQLKIVASLKPSSTYLDEFERSWLMLADIYISTGKFDMAQKLCRQCIKHNQSCSKALEQLGVIMEKERAYNDASEFYERAWKIEGETTASVGFKLAFNYMKAKRHLDAIIVCNKVLILNPKYPKIKKDILDKARAHIRL